MKKLINEPFLFTGLALFNKTKKHKAFKIYNGKKVIMSFVVPAKEAFINHENIYGVVKFDIPIPVENLSVDGGRKWDIIVNRNDKEYVRFTYY